MNKVERPLTVFHIAHQKTGSKWVAEVLRCCAPNRCVVREIAGEHFTKPPIKLGGVYQSLYLAKPEFEMLLGGKLWLNDRRYRNLGYPPRTYLTNWYNFQVRKQQHKKFVIIRDLRDTLVSAYFSFKISYPSETQALARWHRDLNNLDKEQGLRYMMDEGLTRFATIQSSWLDTEALVIKYEDLITNEYQVFKQILDHCQIEVEPQRLQTIVEANSFKAKTGRQPGEENINAHQRKGVAGDWHNHFSEPIKKEFKQRFGDILIKAGYEKDLNW